MHLPRYLCVGGMLCCMTSVSAETLASWEGDGLGDEDQIDVVSWPAASTASNLTVGDWVRGAGITASGGGWVPDAFAAKGMDGTSGVAADDLATAIASDDYFSVTLTPDAGQQLNLSALEFSMDLAGSATAGYAALLTDQTGLTNADALGTVEMNNVLTSIDLSGVAALQGLTGAVELRLYLYGAESEYKKCYFGTPGINDPAVADVTISGSLGSAGTPGISDLNALAVSHEEVQLTWTPVTDPSVTGYRVIRSLDATIDAEDPYVDLVGSSVDSYNDTSLLPNQTYYYEVQARDDL